MNLFSRRRRPERRQPENADMRRRWEAEHAVTDAATRAEYSERAHRAIDRAKEVAQIAAVVTIRTRPRKTVADG